MANYPIRNSYLAMILGIVLLALGGSMHYLAAGNETLDTLGGFLAGLGISAVLIFFGLKKKEESERKS